MITALALFASCAGIVNKTIFCHEEHEMISSCVFAVLRVTRSPLEAISKVTSLDGSGRGRVKMAFNQYPHPTSPVKGGETQRIL